MIVDTGSSVTAIACATCAECGTHVAAGVNLILDVMFKYIISAQAKGDTRDVSEDLTRDNLRLKFHKKVQAQLARLNQGIIRHRESLIGKEDHNELEEFDAQWGVHLSKDGNE